MIITILCIGKVKEKSILDLASEYEKRLSKFQRIKIIEIKDSTQEKESEKILEYVNNHPEQKYILMDERGRIYTTKGLGTYLNQCQNNSEDVTFILSGADGPNAEVKKTIKEKMALSTMTFTHEMARALLLEQIYRVITIWNNIPYHKD